MATQVRRGMIVRARRLRRSLTAGEKKLWMQLRYWRVTRGIHVRKQAPIGPYIADFAVHENRLIIELDGDAHVLQASRDKVRDAWFVERGYRTLRITTADLLDMDACLERILVYLDDVG